MKEDTIAIVLDLVAGFITVIIIGSLILLLPYREAAHRDSLEAVIIDDYLEEPILPASSNQPQNQTDDQPPSISTPGAIQNAAPANPKSATEANSRIYKGEIDSILVIEKINLQKAIIRGPENDYNLNRYLFVTADQTSILGVDNYVIYGHCSQTYGHSFNRLEELAVGDTFQLIQGTTTYEYVVTNIQLEQRELAAPLLDTGTNTVQLVSCEKHVAEGFSEKRLIIVTAERNTN